MSNLNFITQARKILTEDYNIRHTAEYNAWLGGHKNAWMQSHTIIPFPPFIICPALNAFNPVSVAPSESEIVNKALELYNQYNLINNENSSVTESVSAQITPTSAREERAVPLVVQSIEEPVVPKIEEQIVPPVVPKIEEPAVPKIEEPKILNNSDTSESVSVSTPHTDEIYKIFEKSTTSTVELNSPDSPMNIVETELNSVPQPSEELAKLANSEKTRLSILQRLQNMTDKWSVPDREQTNGKL